MVVEAPRNLGELTSKELMDFFFERMGIVQCRMCDIPLIRFWKT
jgi:hypothetical protein